MGLDSYAYLCKKKKEVNRDLYHYNGDHISGFDQLKEDYDIVDEDFDYWRKYYSLHRWMQDLAYRKDENTKDHEFNGSCLRITKNNVNDLEDDVKNDRLDYSWDFWDKEDEVEHLLEFCKMSKNKLQAGYDIFYDSSW